MSYDIEFDFVLEDGVLTIEPCVIEPDPSDTDFLQSELEERFGSEAVVTGTVDEDGNVKIGHVEGEDKTTNEAAERIKTYFFTWEDGELYTMGPQTVGPPKALVDEFIEALTEKYGKDALVSGLFGENGCIVTYDSTDEDDSSDENYVVVTDGSDDEDE